MRPLERGLGALLANLSGADIRLVCTNQALGPTRNAAMAVT
jgi:hypothetical protein